MEITEKLARQAAAEFSTDPVRAVLRYRKLLVEYECDVPSDGKELEKQFLELLEPYRHPVKDEFTEYMIFSDPDGLDVDMGGYQDPPILEKAIATGVEEPLLKELREYVSQKERNNRDLEMCRQDTATLNSAREIYKKNIELRASTRNTAVVQEIGLSSGKRNNSESQRMAWSEYVYLIRRKGLSRLEAIHRIKDQCDLQSIDSTVKFLNRRKEEVLAKCLNSSPQMYPQIEKTLHDIVISNR